MSAELFFIICYFSLIVLCVFGIIWAIKVTRDSEPFWGSDRQWISVLSKITGKDVSKDYKRLSKQIKEEAISKRFKNKSGNSRLLVSGMKATGSQHLYVRSDIVLFSRLSVDCSIPI